MLPAKRPSVKPRNEGSRPGSGAEAFEALFAPTRSPGSEAFDRLFRPGERDRIARFVQLVRAIDDNDVARTIAATRELRKLGLSIVPIGRKPEGGR